MRTGQRVTITYDGRTLDGLVVLASGNGRSLMLSFEGILGGWVGMMPVLADGDGVFRPLNGDEPVSVIPI